MPCFLSDLLENYGDASCHSFFWSLSGRCFPFEVCRKINERSVAQGAAGDTWWGSQSQGAARRGGGDTGWRGWEDFGGELLGVIKGETPDLDAIAGCRVRLKFVPRISFRNLEFASDSNSCTTQIRTQLKFAFKSNCGHSWIIQIHAKLKLLHDSNCMKPGRNSNSCRNKFIHTTKSIQIIHE